MASHDFWIERLSDHLDGHLPADEAGAVAEHLAACAECRAVADDLDEVKRRARALGGMAPPHDLWDGIRSRLDEGSDVVDLTLHLDVPTRSEALAAPRRRSWARVGRAAATVALMLGAGAAGWGLRPALEHGDGSIAALGTGDGAVPGAGVFAASGDAESADALGADVADLERMLGLASDGLDPNTVRVLRKNLAIIQAAVAESRAALEIDPDNAYVRSHLENAVERQRAFVRQASQLLAEAD